jgi:hypothetical protein
MREMSSGGGVVPEPSAWADDGGWVRRAWLGQLSRPSRQKGDHGRLTGAAARRRELRAPILIWSERTPPTGHALCNEKRLYGQVCQLRLDATRYHCQISSIGDERRREDGHEDFCSRGIGTFRPRGGSGSRDADRAVGRRPVGHHSRRRRLRRRVPSRTHRGLSPEWRLRRAGLSLPRRPALLVAPWGPGLQLIRADATLRFPVFEREQSLSRKQVLANLLFARSGP